MDDQSIKRPSGQRQARHTQRPLLVQAEIKRSPPLRKIPARTPSKNGLQLSPHDRVVGVLPAWPRLEVRFLDKTASKPWCIGYAIVDRELSDDVHELCVLPITTTRIIGVEERESLVRCIEEMPREVY
jgi:hypothetical protein